MTSVKKFTIFEPDQIFEQMNNTPNTQTLLSIVTKIAKDLVANYDEISNYGGLYSSKIGLAMFLADYTLHTEDDQFEDFVYQAVTDCLENINLVYGLSLSGVAGIGWGVNYLVSRDALSAEEVTPYMQKLEEVIIASLSAPEEAKNYDLMHGFIGKIVYLIAQYQNGITSEQTLVQAIRTSIQYLEQTAVSNDSSMAWKYPMNNDMEYSLGLSHGQPAILVYLCDVLSLNLLSDEEQQKIRDMVQGILQWLLDKRTINAQQRIAYPQSFTTSQEPKAFNRLAWCYGDLGMAIAFLNAGKALNNETYIKEGKALLLQATEISLQNAGIMINSENPADIDMGFCHGVVGVLHMFHRFGQVLKEEAFQTSKAYWLDVMLKNTQQDELYAGWKGAKSSSENDETKWIPRASLLEGATGIGMVLLHDFIMGPTQGLQWDHFYYTDLINL